MQIYSFHIKALKTVHTQVSPSHTSYGGGLLSSAVDQAMPKSSRVVQSRYVYTQQGTLYTKIRHTRFYRNSLLYSHAKNSPFGTVIPIYFFSMLLLQGLRPLYVYTGPALQASRPYRRAPPRIAGFPRRAPRHTAVKSAAPRLHCPCDTTTSKAFSDPTNRNAIHIRQSERGRQHSDLFINIPSRNQFFLYNKS